MLGVRFSVDDTEVEICQVNLEISLSVGEAEASEIRKSLGISFKW